MSFLSSKVSSFCLNYFGSFALRRLEACFIVWEFMSARAHWRTKRLPLVLLTREPAAKWNDKNASVMCRLLIWMTLLLSALSLSYFSNENIKGYEETSRQTKMQSPLSLVFVSSPPKQRSFIISLVWWKLLFKRFFHPSPVDLKENEKSSFNKGSVEKCFIQFQSLSSLWS